MTSSLQQQPHNIGRQSSSVNPPPTPTQYSHPPPDNLGVGMVVGGPPMLQQPPPTNSHPHPNQQMIGVPLNPPPPLVSTTNCGPSHPNQRHPLDSHFANLQI